ncbi:hypothetical protein [Methylorubrum extorquens]|uniref:Uncharacterized protein n=1 Tax=Methylorubrum extorquens (strain CM4 / NCIMB 13688) TaxID=440085 RepID=B7KYS6_METC4|nr:hypothetical protein [Methylorubrum extorquens]ACK81199.1 hypothetical protein Mchl_0260 [Methylorubrum extorquens CM4]
MTHRSLRLCAILGAAGIALVMFALGAAAVSLKQAASCGDLITMPWSAAR